jgi:hypothetical protein
MGSFLDFIHMYSGVITAGHFGAIPRLKNHLFTFYPFFTKHLKNFLE